MKTPSTYSPWLSFFSAILLLTACAIPPASSPLPLDPPQNFSASGEQQLPARWWTSFDDQQLNALVDTALASNFNLKTAWQRLIAARAVLVQERAGLVPSVDASLQGGISFPLPDFRGGENVRLGLNAGYELDLWGRIRSQADAQEFRVQATLADYQAAAISLSAEITRTWYQLLEARSQLALLEEQLETNDQILQLIENRLGLGQIQSVDILRQRQLLGANREQIVTIEADIQVLNHQLAVLLGRTPRQGPTFTTDSLPELPTLPDTGIPIELVRRRPDIQSAYLSVLAADRDLATAISSRYPRLSISASASLRANNLQSLFKNWAYSFAGNIFAPIFFGGQLQAEVDRSEAVKNQLLYQYGQAVLIAFREVEDALIREQKQLERITQLEQQLELALQANDQLRVSYFNGTSSYLDVLTSLSQEQQLRRDLLSAQLALIEFRIALYRAIAGDIPGLEQ